MTDKVYIGDAGTVIELDCGQDISAATSRSIEVLKPDGSALSWLAVASGASALAYTSNSGSFDQAGTWALQSKVTLPSGAWRGATALLKVYAHFN